ncbi:unnamed protein product [Linum trigynum]|uniref:Uncharacterized protein n=1 Tax=Linum trigynum TaxID=586398 RepID=A0AAV2DFF9_9ROSI
MICSSALNVPNLRQPPSSSSGAEPNPNRSAASVPNSLPLPATGSLPESDSNSLSRKLRGSAQLNRWSRARAIRSGRKLERPGHRAQVLDRVDSSDQLNDQESLEFGAERKKNRGEDDDNYDEVATGKSIYMVSDGTGWTAEHSVNTALGQFEYCLVDRACSVNTHLFSGIDDVDRLMEIVKQAAKEGALVIYTLADPSMAESVRKACEIWGIPSTDILGPITEAISSHIGVSPSGIPRGAAGGNVPLSEEYFQRIEAVEFTIKQDDGNLPKNLRKADIVLVGVSRTGKTPLSIYLAQKGYKVANVPIVNGVDLPRTLFEVDPEKVFALTINQHVLQAIRRARAKTLGFSDESRSNYAEMDHVREELEYAGKVFGQNPAWPVIEVTERAIEETAAVVLRLYHDRKNRCLMPRISKRY